jgi:hypothetical protein
MTLQQVVSSVKRKSDVRNTGLVGALRAALQRRKHRAAALAPGDHAAATPRVGARFRAHNEGAPTGRRSFDGLARGHTRSKMRRRVSGEVCSVFVIVVMRITLPFVVSSVKKKATSATP